jgi:hypothetical protein
MSEATKPLPKEEGLEEEGGRLSIWAGFAWGPGCCWPLICFSSRHFLSPSTRMPCFHDPGREQVSTDSYSFITNMGHRGCPGLPSLHGNRACPGILGGTAICTRTLPHHKTLSLTSMWNSTVIHLCFFICEMGLRISLTSQGSEAQIS